MYYCQWSLPVKLGIKNSNSVHCQKEQYIKYSKQISYASEEGRDMIVLTDENIDILDDVSDTNYYKNSDLKVIHDSNVINYSLS